MILPRLPNEKGREIPICLKQELRGPSASIPLVSGGNYAVEGRSVEEMIAGRCFTLAGFHEYRDLMVRFRVPVEDADMFERVVTCVLLSCCLVGCGAAQGNGAVAVAGRRVQQPDPDKSAVEKWLRENLDSGKWEEIEWRPCPDMKAICEKRISNWMEESKRAKHALETTPDNVDTQQVRNQLLESISNIEINIDSARYWSQSRICGIKIRTDNQFGAKVVVEKIFDIYDGSLVPISQVDRQYIGWQYLRGEIN